MNKVALGLTLSSILLGACSSPGGTTGGSSSAAATSTSTAASKSGGTASTGSTKAEPAKAAAKKIDKLGLTADVPAEATVTALGDGIMVSTDACTLTLKAAGDTDPKTVEDGKNGAMLGDKGRNLKGEKTADGWLVTFENTGSAGDNYWMTMRREIGKKGYMCETTQSNEDQRKCAIAICNSLKP